MFDANIWQLALVILTSLGGGGFIVGGLARYIGNIWAERIAEKLRSENAKDLERVRSDFFRELESYRTKLRKSELIFEKEVDAVSAFVAMFYDIHPEHASPDMDFSEACDEIAMSFGSIEKKLKQYLIRYGAILIDDQRDLLKKSISTATAGKFELANSEEISTKGNELATNLFDLLLKLEIKLITGMRNQASQ